MNKIKQLLNNFVSIFYPRSCVACGNALMQNESHFCLSCLMHLPETNYHLMENSPMMNETFLPVKSIDTKKHKTHFFIFERCRMYVIF